MSACACGRDKCNGNACGNFGANGCKGVDWSLPPWDCAARNAEYNRDCEENQRKWKEGNK